MKNAIWLLLVVACAACNSTPPQETAAAPAPPDLGAVAPVVAVKPDGFLDSAWFKVGRLDTFRVAYRTGKEGGFDLGTEKLVKLTRAQEQRYLQLKPRRRAERQIAPYYFYSLQQNTPVRQEITVLHDDGEYFCELLRLVYDARHHLISKQAVAGFGADGGQLLESYGRFETPAQFRLVTVQKSGSADSVSDILDIDSTVALYGVTQAKFRKLEEKKYTASKRTPLAAE